AVCRGAGVAGALEPASWLRMFAVGGGGDAAVAVFRRGVFRARVLGGAGRADPDRTVAGRDRGPGLRVRARGGPAALAVLWRGAGRCGAGRAAVADGGDGGLVVDRRHQRG